MTSSIGYGIRSAGAAASIVGDRQEKAERDDSVLKFEMRQVVRGLRKRATSRQGPDDYDHRHHHDHHDDNGSLPSLPVDERRMARASFE